MNYALDITVYNDVTIAMGRMCLSKFGAGVLDVLFAAARPLISLSGHLSILFGSPLPRYAAHLCLQTFWTRGDPPLHGQGTTSYSVA